jgi:hypothetical protein
MRSGSVRRQTTFRSLAARSLRSRSWAISDASSTAVCSSACVGSDPSASSRSDMARVNSRPAILMPPCEVSGDASRSDETRRRSCKPRRARPYRGNPDQSRPVPICGPDPTLIGFGLASSVFGRVSVRTAFSNVVRALSASTARGRVICRMYSPGVTSWTSQVAASGRSSPPSSREVSGRLPETGCRCRLARLWRRSHGRRVVGRLVHVDRQIVPAQRRPGQPVSRAHPTVLEQAIHAVAHGHEVHPVSGESSIHCRSATRRASS